jgi:hypothetical protein
MAFHGVLTAVLTGRLFVLSVLPDWGPAGRAGPGVRLRAQAEHLRTVATDDGRGRILYRNGLPVRTGSDPLFGSVGLPDRWPDPDRPVPEQGRSGLQHRFDRVLASRRAGHVGLLEDAGGRPQGLLYRLAPEPGLDVRTTLDPAWQRVAEAALSEHGVAEGAVVVLDVSTGEALAVASRSRDGGITAVRTYTPGSVFKLVTAAAALESFRFRGGTRFVCRGEADIPGVRMRCWRVHGVQTLAEALADSCDAVFAGVGVRVGRPGFEEMGRRLHLAEPQVQTGFGGRVLAEAEGGRVFAGGGDDNGRMANTAIGQQDVRLSPLVAANLARTIAAGGRWRPVRLALGAERGGRTLAVFPGGDDERVLSPYTAAWLADAMRQAVASSAGTAHALAGLPVASAVKTGTAERPDGRVNAWIAGFAPATAPRIAFCAMVAGERSARAHRQVFGLTSDLLRACARFDPASAAGGVGVTGAAGIIGAAGAARVGELGRDARINPLPSSGIDSMMVRGWRRGKRLPKE